MWKLIRIVSLRAQGWIDCRSSAEDLCFVEILAAEVEQHWMSEGQGNFVAVRCLHMLGKRAEDNSLVDRFRMRSEAELGMGAVGNSTAD